MGEEKDHRINKIRIECPALMNKPQYLTTFNVFKWASELICSQSCVVNSVFTMTKIVKLERGRKVWTKCKMKENKLKASIYAFLMKAKTLTKYTVDFVAFEN